MPKHRTVTTLNDVGEHVRMAVPVRMLRPDDRDYWREVARQLSQQEGAPVSLADIGERLTALHRLLSAQDAEILNEVEL